MSNIQIHKNNRNFILDGIPFFYLADTVWSAFTNITMEEWEVYLAKRKEQGFNVLQINTLPQWDRSMSDLGVYPFATKDGIKLEFGKWNQAYYERAKTMCQMAVDYGFHLALVVLWLNHVPDTWGSRISAVNVMPQEFLKAYAKKIFDEFDQFNPIYVVSGDTDFNSEEAISYYRTILQTLCELSPDSLKTLHIKRGYDFIPDEFLDKIDFYMFQSGHNMTAQDMAYKLAHRLYETYPPKPVINAEPCYEQMGFSQKKYGRFERYDLRKAAWSSLLSGACAGVTYGAHGIWNWRRVREQKNPILGEGFDEAPIWEEALQLPGAWDYGYIKYLFEEYAIVNLTPANELLENGIDDIRMGKTQNGEYLIYLPSNTNIIINKDLSKYRIRMIDLEKKNVACSEVQQLNGRTIIKLHRFERDVLVIVSDPEHLS